MGALCISNRGDRLVSARTKMRFLDTKGIVTIAILGSLGGALSTFVGYLGNLINLSLGVPFGAGQFLAGLHVFWLVLMRVLVPRRGVGTAGGLLKGVVEMFTGSTHGIVIVFVSLVQGFFVDIAAEAGGGYDTSVVRTRIFWWFGAGLASASNVWVLQAFYFSGIDWLYILLISTLAFCSGVVFAGYFAWETVEFLNDSGIVFNEFQSIRPQIEPATKQTMLHRNVPAILIILFITVGSLFYFTVGTSLLSDPDTCQVSGLVEHSYLYRPSDFVQYQVTIEAELVGAYTHLPPANYTGVLLSVILSQASPLPEATSLRVIARDGYTMVFSRLNDVLSDQKLILSQSGTGLWLIAANYDGSYWVQKVQSLQVF
jgi:ABC-type thiamin/hydroxymethylpyrimidine transport system permease subunit